ncbi:MAG: ribonuclease III [Clostridia bacterium]|nr:ribonuclease III [Clostridia bacterium]MBQ9993128.1 ribonuclease III [Clostridia bacterium]
MELLEKRIGYTFRDKELLRTALTHSSYANEMHRGECNERLEFLGDAVLSIVVSEYIFNHYRNKKEGDLTKLRASLVCESTLAGFARQLRLGDFLLLGKGERRTNGADRPSILADGFEALIAAIYLDGGMDSARRFVLEYTEPEILSPKVRKTSDYKTTLQEIVQQSSGEILEYVLVGESGPDHNKHFVAEVHLNSNVIGRGGGHSKKEAEQQAARAALELMGAADMK